jgi:hypothetical protein
MMTELFWRVDGPILQGKSAMKNKVIIFLAHRDDRLSGELLS